jgi:hypothetical protein
MKIYTVIDWSPQMLYPFTDDNEALAKFRDIAISAEAHEYASMECFDTDTKESDILIMIRNGKISAYDNSLSGIAADMYDERCAALAEERVQEE